MLGIYLCTRRWCTSCGFCDPNVAHSKLLLLHNDFIVGTSHPWASWRGGLPYTVKSSRSDKLMHWTLIHGAVSGHNVMTRHVSLVTYFQRSYSRFSEVHSIYLPICHLNYQSALLLRAVYFAKWMWSKVKAWVATPSWRDFFGSAFVEKKRQTCTPIRSIVSVDDKTYFNKPAVNDPTWSPNRSHIDSDHTTQI